MSLLIVLPPREYLQECFTYCEETGILTWNVRPRTHFRWDYAWLRFNKYSAGKPAGMKLHRDKAMTDPLAMRVKLQYGGKVMFPSVHRIAFALKGIEISEGSIIDHRDGNPFNNQWSNLRVATPSQNCCNKKRAKIGDSNLDLPKGVSRYGKLGKFRVACMVNGKSTQKYGFLTADEAYAEYCKLSQEMHGSFHRPA